MIIFGEHADDTGTQLEELTRRLLQDLGFQNIELNAVGVGGHEIDIRAEYNVPVLGGGNQPEHLIGECKAHQNAINSTDWLKFIGKIHVESIIGQRPIRGLFIALSGVNGNVRASYRDLVERRQNITLIEGDGLLTEVQRLFGGVSRQEAVVALGKYTSRQFTAVDVGYRDRRLYWVFSFGDGAVAVLNSDGVPLSGPEMQVLEPMIQRRMDNAPVINLLAEQEARLRKMQIQKRIISLVFVLAGTSKDDVLREHLKEFSNPEITDALKDLTERGWLVASEDANWSLIPNVDSGLEGFVEILRFFLSEGIIVEDYERLVSSEVFDKLFDDQAIATISKIQGGMPIPEENRAHILWLARYSPSGLAYALRPDPHIVIHRIKQPDVTHANTDAHDARYFVRTLAKYFINDFRNGALARYYFFKCGLVEIETEQGIKIKSKESIVIDLQTNERIGIGEMSEVHGGGLIFIDILTDAPEPWEWMKPRTDQESSSSSSDSNSPAPQSPQE